MGSKSYNNTFKAGGRKPGWLQNDRDREENDGEEDAIEGNSSVFWCLAYSCQYSAIETDVNQGPDVFTATAKVITLTALPAPPVALVLTLATNPLKRPI